jgi:RelA/SpoT family (p)ppGpp synthetase
MEKPGFVTGLPPKFSRRCVQGVLTFGVERTASSSVKRRQRDLRTKRRPRSARWSRQLSSTAGDSLPVSRRFDLTSVGFKTKALSPSENDLLSQSWDVLRERTRYLDQAAAEKLRHALDFAFAAHSGQLRRSGEPFITHPVAVTLLLADLRMDIDTLVAGLLHDAVEDTDLTFDTVERLFGHDVRNIVESETKVSKIARKMKPSRGINESNGVLLDPVSMIAAAASAAAAAASAAAAAVRSRIKDLRLDHDLSGGDEVDAATLETEFHNRGASLNGPGSPAIVEKRRTSSAALTKEEQQAEYIRRMFVSMAEDVRVIIVKLADRLHNMRTLEHMPALKQQRIAQETLGIFVPLAHRLGLVRFATELEDLSFRFLYPKEYAQLSEQVRIYKDRIHLEMNLAQAADMLVESLENDTIVRPVVRSIRTEVALKNLFSIYQRIRQGARLESMHDLAFVRLIVELEKEHEGPAFERNICYHVLGRVHSLFRPFPGHVKDFVAYPKPNGYQSLHTLVILGPKGGFHPLEVQIFTESMYVQAEFGIAVEFWPERKFQSMKNDEMGLHENCPKNHWQTRTEDWLRTILEYCQQYSGNSKACVDAVQQDLLGNRVYVFTPKNYILDLPKGSTVVDAAYHIHSDVGNQMIGARVAGRFVPLDHELSNADSVKIITSPAAPGPSREWLRYARSRTAKQKIRRFLRAREVKESCERGRDILRESARQLELDEQSVPGDASLEAELMTLAKKACPPDRAKDIRCLEDLLIYIYRTGGVTAAAKILCHFHRNIDPALVRKLEAQHPHKSSETLDLSPADRTAPDFDVDVSYGDDDGGSFSSHSSMPTYLNSNGVKKSSEFFVSLTERPMVPAQEDPADSRKAKSKSAARASDLNANQASEQTEELQPECFAACCCNPVPGDRIVAIRIRPASRGVPAAFEVHRLRCTRCLSSLRGDPEACVSVRWRLPRSLYPVRIAIMARDGPGLLSRVAGCITGVGLSIVASSSRVSKDTAILFFEIVVERKEQIERLRASLAALGDVIEICRVRDHLGLNEVQATSSYAQTLARLQPGEVEVLAMAGSLLEHEVADADNEEE